MRHFLCVSDCSTEELNELLDLSSSLKKLYKTGGRDLCLVCKVLAMVFEPSHKPESPKPPPPGPAAPKPAPPGAGTAKSVGESAAQEDQKAPKR